MKKTVALVCLLVVALCCGAAAQTTASNYNYNLDSLTALTASTFTFPRSACSVTLPGGKRAAGPSASDTVRIIDASAASNETLAQTAPTQSGGACKLNPTSASYDHYSYRVRSGTCGLVPAIKDRGTTGTVTVDQQFYNDGCTASTITGAAVAAASKTGILIHDISDGKDDWYTTAANTTAYGKSSSVASTGNAQTLTLGTATPATTRAIVGSITVNYAGSVTPSGSGSIVGVRGAATVAAGTTFAGSYMYGAQGKVTITGTVDGNAWIAGVLGQLDPSAGTLTAAAHLTPGWFDMGATGPTGTKAFMDGVVITNTIAGLQINSLVYGYAKASYVFDFTGANGTPFALSTSGTSAGQCAQSGGIVASKAMPVKIDGVNYWIPLCSAL